MTWQVVLTERARRDLLALDRAIATRVIDSLERLATTGSGNVRRILGSDNELRLRVGQWRVRLVYDYETAAIHVLRVLHRSQAYRR